MKDDDEARTWPQHHFSRYERHQLSWWITQNWCFLLQCSYSMYGKCKQTRSHFNWLAGWRPQLWRILGVTPVLLEPGCRCTPLSESVRVDLAQMLRRLVSSVLWNMAADSPAPEVRAMQLQRWERRTRYITLPNILSPLGQEIRETAHTPSSLMILLHTILYKKIIITTFKKSF